MCLTGDCCLYFCTFCREPRNNRFVYYQSYSMISHPYVEGIHSLRIDGLTNLNSISPALNGVQVSPSSQSSEPSTPIDDSPEDFMLAKNYARGQMQKNLIEQDRCTSFRHHPHRTTADWCDVGQVSIDILFDDILLCIFLAYMDGFLMWREWHNLVHVCRRWRTLVFGSPHHLNLRLFCSGWTPVSTGLDI
jgi:hypothetical protein